MTGYSRASLQSFTGHSLQCATKIASASRCSFSDDASSGDRSASIGTTFGGTIWLRMRRRRPTPHLRHHSAPCSSRSAVHLDSKPYHADVSVGVLIGCTDSPLAATSVASPLLPNGRYRTARVESNVRCRTHAKCRGHSKASFHGAQQDCGASNRVMSASATATTARTQGLRRRRSRAPRTIQPTSLNPFVRRSA